MQRWALTLSILKLNPTFTTLILDEPRNATFAINFLSELESNTTGQLIFSTTQRATQLLQLRFLLHIGNFHTKIFGLYVVISSFEKK